MYNQYINILTTEISDTAIPLGGMGIDKLSAAGLNAVHVCGSFVTCGNGGLFQRYNHC